MSRSSSTPTLSRHHHHYIHHTVISNLSVSAIIQPLHTYILNTIVNPRHHYERLILPYLRGGWLYSHPAIKPQHEPKAQPRGTSGPIESLRSFNKLWEKRPKILLNVHYKNNSCINSPNSECWTDNESIHHEYYGHAQSTHMLPRFVVENCGL